MSTTTSGKRHPSDADAPAWIDEDDASHVVVARGTSRAKYRTQKKQRLLSGDAYQAKLREAFEDVHPAPKWATTPSSSSSASGALDGGFDSANDVLQSTSSLVVSSHPSILRKGELDERKLRHINSESRAAGGAHSVQFHVNGELVLVGGKKAKLFQLDHKKNPCVQHVQCHKRFRMEKAQFTPDGSKLLMSGNKPWLFSYDLVSGAITKIHRFMELASEYESYRKTYISPDGATIAIAGAANRIHLVSSLSRKYIASLQANEGVESICFEPTSKHLWSVGVGGNVYQWDVGTRRCIKRFKDEGSNRSTSIGISRDESHYAIGSGNGIVNVYRSETLSGCHGTRGTPSPSKAISSLRTSVNHTMFNDDGQLLAISSGDVLEGAVKMVHVPTLTVFQRWPLHHVTGNVLSMDFSPGSKYVAVGTTKGTAHLWRLNHYV